MSRENISFWELPFLTNSPVCQHVWIHPLGTVAAILATTSYNQIFRFLLISHILPSSFELDNFSHFLRGHVYEGIRVSNK